MSKATTISKRNIRELIRRWRNMADVHAEYSYQYEQPLKVQAKAAADALRKAAYQLENALRGDL